MLGVCYKIIYKELLTELIIYIKKLLDSDWLRAGQFKCKTSAKGVTPVQITHRTVPDYDWLKDNF